jgi:hypothetical protein
LPPAQLVRIGLAQEPFERERARARKAQAKGKRRGEKTLPVELPEEKGETRELIARSVGLKPSTYARGAKVLREGSPELVAAFEAERETVNGAGPSGWRWRSGSSASRHRFPRGRSGLS